MTALRALDDGQARMVQSVCDVIVPGSARVGPEVYIDALLAGMDDGARAATIAEFAAVADGDRGSPGFMHVRALCIEAFYSDFVAPGIEATSAWQEIDFSTPQAMRLAKDWSYLGIHG
jgi:hypothetical protein